MEREKPRLTATERDALMGLNVALEILDEAPGQLKKERVKMLRNAARDLGLIRSKIKDIMTGMAMTIPEDQIKSYLRNLTSASYKVGVKSPMNGTRDMNGFGLWLSYNQIGGLMDGCHDRCLMCNLDKAERRACPLKKVLDSIPNDAPDRSDGDCPYYGVI